MKLVGLVCVLVAVVSGAPAPALLAGESPVEVNKEELLKQEPEMPSYRVKRSGYAPVYAPAPCGAAPAYIAPIHHAAYAPHYYGHGIPHYRNIEDQETMSFSDMDGMQQQMLAEHIPMARYPYGPSAGALAVPVPVPSHYDAAGLAGIGGIGVGAGGASGPAIGVFPNANVGGCSVPLLLSCSPSIRHGHIVKTQQPYAEAYRGVDEPAPLQEHQESPHHEHLTPTNEATHPLHQ